MYITPLMKLFHESTENKFSYLRLSDCSLFVEKKTLRLTLTHPEDIDISAYSAEIEAVFRRVLGLSLINPELHFKRSHFDSAHFLPELSGIILSYPALRDKYREGDVTVSQAGGRREVKIKLPKSYYEYAVEERVADKLMQFAIDNYCEEINIGFTEIEDDFSGVEEGNTDIMMQESRVICPSSVTRYTGDTTDTASYIADIKSERSQVTLCGRVRNPQKLNKKNKTGDEIKDSFFKFVLDDSTDSINCLIFPNKGTYQKLCDITQGMEIICDGQVKQDTFGGRESLTFWVKNISLCEFPKNFKSRTVTKPLPSAYSAVEVKRIPDKRQITMDPSGNVLPDYLVNNTFVVVDVETTGLSPKDCTIIEIGAVKIKDGHICEEFSTFVNPLAPVPQEITRLTGITDGDVALAPTIEGVIADFALFCDGCILVAHNMDFDYSFLSQAARANGYQLNNELLDTIVIAKNTINDLRLFNLKALCNYLGVVNEGAHRAIYDAHATAECLIKLLKKQCLAGMIS